MSRITVGKRWSRSLPRGDVQQLCDYCGTQWHRSQLRKDGDGLWACPDEGAGLPQGELGLLNAADAAAYAERRVEPVSAKMDTDDGSDTPVQRLTLEDIYS